MGHNKIWIVESHRGEEARSFIPCSIVSKKDDAGLQQENSSKTVMGRRTGVEKGLSQSVGSQGKIDAQLGWHLCGKKGFLYWGTNVNRDGQEYLGKPG